MPSQIIGSKNANSQPSQAQPPARSRLVYLDNLRTGLITAVVLGHLSVTYGADFDWYYYEGGTVSPLVYILQLMILAIGISFAMGLFFMIAGYFCPSAYDRKGTGRFLADRFKKLGIAWLFFEIVINPLVHYAVDVHGGDCKGAFYDCQFQGTFWQYLIEYPKNIGSIASSPLWFVEALLIFSVFYALWRVISKSAHLRVPSTVPSNGAIALFALGIGLVSFIVRFWVKAYVQYEPLHLEFARFPQYIALFAAGVLAYRGDWLTTFSDRQARTWRWVVLGSIATLPIITVPFGPNDERLVGGVNGLSLTFSLWEGFLCVSMVITIISWFRHHWNYQGRLARAMSESAFAVYVLQVAIIVPLALVLSDIQMNLSLKFLLVAPVAVGLCYLIAYVLRKMPIARSILG